jgi:uncharacterized protein YuzE
MNASEALSKIADLLGMKFKSEKFFITKLIDGTTEITNNQEGPFSIGEDLFIVDESVLKPAPVGRHETREGLILEVDESGKIIKIEDKPESSEEERIQNAEREIEVETEVMSKATLTDGTKVMTESEGDFEVGQELYVETESGEKVKAPAGEHTTESGITLTVDGEGKITGVKYPDEEGEGSLENYKKNMDDVKMALGSMLEMMEKFTKEFEEMKEDYQEFKKSPAYEKPVVKKTFGKENILDAKYEFLREALSQKKK